MIPCEQHDGSKAFLGAETYASLLVGSSPLPVAGSYPNPADERTAPMRNNTSYHDREHQQLESEPRYVAEPAGVRTLASSLQLPDSLYCSDTAYKKTSALSIAKLILRAPYAAESEKTTAAAAVV